MNITLGHVLQRFVGTFRIDRFIADVVDGLTTYTNHDVLIYGSVLHHDRRGVEDVVRENVERLVNPTLLLHINSSCHQLSIRSKKIPCHAADFKALLPYSGHQSKRYIAQNKAMARPK